MMARPILVGVDESPDSIRATLTALALGRAAGADCRLIHAVRDPWVDVPLESTPADMEERCRLVLEWSRERVVGALEGSVPAELIAGLQVRFGPAAVVLSRAAEELDAELVVLGGKRHPGFSQWLAGRTAHDLIRILNRPVLVTRARTDETAGFRRILAAVDLSATTEPILEQAGAWARQLGAAIKVLHVVPPLPSVPGLREQPAGELVTRTEQELRELLATRLPQAEYEVRSGEILYTIGAAIDDWQADLLMVATHGRGWVNRIIIGSVTRTLLTQLPAATLVVPIPQPATPAAARGRSGSAKARARPSRGKR